MPNYVRTILHFEGTPEEVAAVKRAISNEGESIDFNEIIPMPEELNIQSSTLGDEGIRIIKGEEIAGREKTLEQRIEAVRLGLQYLDNTRKYGYPTWYEWRTANWGTKWNADCLGEGEEYVEFQTAWDFPYPIVVELSKMFPEVGFRFLYADEDASYNTGSGLFKNGEAEEINTPEGGSPEGWENYFKVWGEDEDYIRQEDGTYKYKDE